MDWIFDHFQIVVLVLIGIGSMLKSAWEAKKRRELENATDYDPVDHVPIEEDQSYRKGGPRPMVPPPLPAEATPPELPRRRRAPKAPAVEYVASEEAAAILRQQQDLADHFRQLREAKDRVRTSTSGGAAATRARVAGKGVPQAASAATPSLRRQLRDPGQLRRAVILREILGPPVGLR